MLASYGPFPMGDLPFGLSTRPEAIWIGDCYSKRRTLGEVTDFSDRIRGIADVRRFTWLWMAFAGIVLAGTIGFRGSGWAQGDEDKGKEITVEGEIVDLQCFMIHPDDGQGEKHAKCANECIAKGLPVGLLVKDQVYLLVGPDHGSMKDVVAKKGGQKISVTGTLLDRDGMMAIKLEKPNENKDGEKGDEQDHGK